MVGLSGLMHGMLHALISGNSLAGGGAFGDMGDIITSPNDVSLFMPMHANLDRNSLMWAANLQVRVCVWEEAGGGAESAGGAPATPRGWGRSPRGTAGAAGPSPGCLRAPARRV